MTAPPATSTRSVGRTTSRTTGCTVTLIGSDSVEQLSCALSDRRVGNSVVLLSGHGLSLRLGDPKPVDSAGQPTALDATAFTQP